MPHPFRSAAAFGSRGRTAHRVAFAVSGAFASVATDGLSFGRCVVVREIETREFGTGCASGPTDGAPRGNRQRRCQVLPPSSVRVVKNRYPTGFDDVKKPHVFAR